MITLLRELGGSRELLVNLTRREIKGKYKRTALGQLWSLANPIALMLIYTAVFSVIINIPADVGDPSGLNVFAVWLMCGLLPWSFFTNTVTSGMGSLVGNENLIKKVAFPRVTLVASSSLAAMFTWAIEMLVLAVVLVFLGADVWLWIPGVVLMMVLLALFATGVAMMLAMANVYFRDTQHFVTIVFQAWFYLTPILYPVSYVAGISERTGPLLGSVTILDLYRLNPMERFVEVFRNLLYDNRLPELDSLAWCVGWTVVALAVGGRVFSRNQAKLAEVL
ncbi:MULTISPECIES: ABC transporter permease [unclassified Actinotalea]|uniref:ABC transporter permease n=1 Tax=unclassified Actinotalea TaxID=2638618 RepID=UPI002102D6E0|nr:MULTISPECIES: ABC transporter permease [unclassified Actinotalea]